MLEFLRRIIGSGAHGSAGALTGDHALIARHIEPGYYGRQLPGAPEDSAGAARHYLEIGWKLGLDPSENFSTRAYLEANSDVRAAGMNPYVHYLRHGRSEGRQPVAGRPAAQIEALDAQTAVIAEAFDVAFYRFRNPDVDFSVIDPVRHYLLSGAAEGRDPCAEFSTSYYLGANPDVRQQGINPFFHYCKAGRSEGRLPARPGGFRTEVLRSLKPLAEEVNGWRFRAPTAEPLAADDLAARLGQHLGGKRRAVLVFSHDDYRSVVGGAQLVMQFEQAAFRDMGISYINLHPVQPLPVLADLVPDAEPLMHLVIDGTLVGATQPSTLGASLRETAAEGVRFDLVVHALHGHAPEHVADIARAAQVEEALYWVHDYFALCAGHTLLRNKVAYCGAPPPESPACSICTLGDGRRRHADRMRTLFEAVPFTVVAPSETAMRVWRGGTDLPVARSVVHPHCQIETTAPVESRQPTRDDPEIRVAFIGYPSVHKGWPAFAKLVRHFGGSADFAFYHLGARHTDEPGVQAVPVSVTQQQPAAMVEELGRCGIDVVILWSLWPETFSFAAHEALAAGALIVTHADAGNISRLVQDREAGWVCTDEDQLVELFRSEELRETVQRRRRAAHAPCTLDRSRFSADLIQEPAAETAAQRAAAWAAR